MKYDYNMVASSRFQTLISDEELKNKISVIKYLTEECNEIGGGYLYIRHRDGRINFIEYKDGKHMGITRQMDRVYDLARRDYMQCRIEYLRANIDRSFKKDSGIRMQNAEKALQSLLKKYDGAKLDLRKIIYTKAQYQWQKFPQSMRINPDATAVNEAYTNYITDGGVVVRSKEEQAIGNMMETMGIAYRYEPVVEIGGASYYPSFAIMTENKRLVLIEYLPETDKITADKNMVKRLVAYKEADIEVGRDLFLAFACDTDKSYKLVILLNQIMSITPGNNNVLKKAVRLNQKN